MDVKHLIVVLVRVAGRPFLDRAQFDALVNARGVKRIAVHVKRELLPVPRSVGLGRGGPMTCVRRPVSSLSRIGSNGSLGNATGSFIGSGSPATTTSASSPVGNGWP